MSAPPEGQLIGRMVPCEPVVGSKRDVALGVEPSKVTLAPLVSILTKNAVAVAGGVTVFTSAVPVLVF